jgi:thiol-disulfide isomerase/thioredoxin
MRVPPILSSAVVVPLLALALLTTGCGRSATAVVRNLAANPAAGSPDGAKPSPASGQPAVTPESLTFTGTTLDGNPFDAASLAGRPVILWFWAPWCAFCFGQGSTVNDLATKYSGRVSLLGVAGLEQNTKAMKSFVADAEVGNILHLNDRTGVVWKKFGIKEQSTYVMIDRTGKVVLTGWQDTVTLTQWAAYLDQH